jgi:hypothetical protein
MILAIILYALPHATGTAHSRLMVVVTRDAASCFQQAASPLLALTCAEVQLGADLAEHQAVRGSLSDVVGNEDMVVEVELDTVV